MNTHLSVSLVIRHCPHEGLGVKSRMYPPYPQRDRKRRLTGAVYHASDKNVGNLLDRSWSHDTMKITVLGVETRIGRVFEFEAGGEQSKMADDELVAMDLPR